MLRERIMVYGNAGTGKTNNWVSIAGQYPKAPVYILDTDDSAERVLEGEDMPNVYIHSADSWEDFDKGTDDFLKKINLRLAKSPPKRREDAPWLVVDMADHTWDMVQNYFTEQVFNKDIGEFFLQARKSLRGGQLQPLEGWTDWQVINKIFQGRWRSITTSGSDFHVYLTSGAKKSDSIEGRTLYKATKSYMPNGEKRMPHRVHTLLYAAADKEGWFVTAAKDRKRELVDDLRIHNFAVNYLVRHAEWSPE